MCFCSKWFGASLSLLKKGGSFTYICVLAAVLYFLATECCLVLLVNAMGMNQYCVRLVWLIETPITGGHVVLR